MAPARRHFHNIAVARHGDCRALVGALVEGEAEVVAGAVVASACDQRRVHVVVDPLARAHLVWRVGGGWGWGVGGEG